MVGHCSLPACYKAASRAPRRGEACIRPERSGRAASGNSWWDKFVGTFAVRRNSRSDHDRGRFGYGETNRVPAHAAQLRRVPQVRVVLLGPPGAGKGTQAEKLSEKLGVRQLYTGELFRDNIRRGPKLRSGTTLGLEARRYLDAGDLVPSYLTNALVEDRISQPDAADGFILDGYPRSVAQAEGLTRMLGNRPHQ